jgi:hypothetical protein
MLPAYAENIQTSRDEILLEGMRFYACHGVNPEERALGQRFTLVSDMGFPLGHGVSLRAWGFPLVHGVAIGRGSSSLRVEQCSGVISERMLTAPLLKRAVEPL